MSIKELANIFPHADKVLHFIAGALIAFVISVFVGVEWYGFAGSFIAGLYKEFSDHMKKGAGGIQTWLDWFATMAGGLAVELLFY